MNKSDQISELKFQVENFKLTRTGNRQGYPQSIREAVQNLQRQGMSINQISTLVGVPYDSVQNWCTLTAAKKSKKLKLNPQIPKSMWKSQMFST